MKIYCLFCKTGSENAVAKCINIYDKEIKALAPVRVLQEKRLGHWELSEKILIPGYVFVYVEDELTFDMVEVPVDVYRILQYQAGERELTGSDYDYALWIYKHNGRIVPSSVLLEGTEVRVLDGPLMDIAGKIIRIDRHKRRAWVEFDFEGSTQKVSLSVIEIIPT